MGDDDWNEVTRKNRGYRTKEDDLAKVSMSIYVTNFPESCSAKDLFQSCKVYGHVVDSYIPLKRSKSGERFGFVRFINVFCVERLISNLCTIWIGKFRLHANITRFQRPYVNTNASVPFGGNGKAPLFMFITPRAILPPSNSFVSAVKGSSTPLLVATLPAIVLDEECLVDRDLDNSVMGEVLHFSSLNNLRVLLYNEGFADVVFMLLARFLGDDYASHCLGDSEGVPLTRGLVNSFHKMGLIWGEFLKLLIIGKVFMVRAKELFVWSPSFKDVPEVIQCSDVNSFKNAAVNDIEDIPDANVEEESNCEAVSDTCFGDSEEVPVKEKENIQSVNDKEVSKDPFGIYEILNRSKVGVNPESSIPYPPGFTPEEGNETTMFVNISQEVQEEHHKSASCSSRVFEEVENSDIYVQSEGKEGRPVRKEGGSILDALDDMIKVGQAMGFTMDGCSNDMEKIIRSNGEHEWKVLANLSGKEGDHKIVWVKWIKVLAAKKFGGLGVSSFFALNRGLIAKWVWRFISGDNSLWCKFISATHGSSHSTSNVTYPSIWKSILKEFYSLKVQGIDIFSHCKIKIGNGLCTRFWKDRWLDNTSLAESFPRLFALETDIDISVAAKLQSIVASFRRSVRGGVEDHQLQQLVSMLHSVILSSSNDRWICDLNGDRIFRVGVVDEAGAGATRGVSWDVLLKWWFLGGRGVGGVISAWSGVTTSGVVMVIRGLGQPHLIILAWSGGVSSVDGLGGMLVGWLWGGGLEAVVIMVSLLGDARKWGADAVGEWSRAWGGAGVRGVSSQSSVLMPRQAICACSRYAYFI
ncbi:RNA-directed DNA polymerase, eukaryota [Tanacetum coccineum]